MEHSASNSTKPTDSVGSEPKLASLKAPDIIAVERRDRGACSSPLALRRAESSDAPFVFSTWLRGWYAQKAARNARREFDSYWRARILELLSNSHTQLWVLCATENPDHIAGWASFTRIGDKAALHWAHIKGRGKRGALPGYRGLGLLWKLLGAGGIDRHTAVVYTFPCPAVRDVCARFRAMDEYPLEEFLA